jgi:hypothetical protein
MHTNYIVLGSPEIHIYGVEDSKERESPGNAINYHSFSLGEELVDYGAEKEDVDKRPNEERPWGRSNVGLFAMIVYALGCGDSVNV